MKLFLLRILVWVILRGGIYAGWSRVYRFLWERKYNVVKLHTYASLAELGAYLETKAKLWAADSWRQFFDAIGTPGRVQLRFEGLEPITDGLDCDDFAIWIANVVQRSLASGKLSIRHQVTAPQLLTVTWLDAKGHATGHNVCLLRSAASWAYMDYGTPLGHSTTIADVAQKVMWRYAGAGAKLLVWATHDKDLKHLQTHWG